MQSHSVTGWLHSLRDGDEVAAEELWNRFFRRLSTAAARKLRQGSVRVVEGEDVALDALDSFCRRMDAGEFPELHDRDGLWRLLLTMTENKAINQIRHERAQKRGAGQVRGDSIFFAAGPGEQAGGFDRFASIEPTPDDVAVMTETLSELLCRLTDGQREIAIKKMQGYSNREISDQISLSVATVERRLNQIRREWSEAHGDR